MEVNDRPEIDTSSFLNKNGKKYQMIVGCSNWSVILGRFNILFSISNMDHFSSKPWKGHLKIMSRIFGYLKHHDKGGIKFDKYMPDILNYTIEKHNWSYVYPGAKEQLPDNMPKTRGKLVRITTYFDANHDFDLDNQRSTRGLLLFIDYTAVKWHSKRQNTVEISTFGSDTVAGHIATDISVEFRYTLRMLGVPVINTTILFGENKSVIINTNLLASKLKKKHNAIAYNCIQEAVASRIIDLVHIPGITNISNVLTKPFNGSVHRKIIAPVLL